VPRVRANGLEFQFSRYRSGAPGDRPLVVGVHGLGIVDNASLSFTLGMPLAKTFELLTYDLRGHGRSQWVPSGYQVTDHVADLVALLDALEVDRPVHLLGGSYGGAIAIVAAIRHPDRVASLSLVDPNFPNPGWGERLAQEFEGYIERLHGEDPAQEILDGLGSRARRRADSWVEQGRRLLIDTTVVADARNEDSLSLEDYAGITCPVLAVFGEDSELYPNAELLRRLVKGAEIVTVPDADHIYIFHRAETRDAVTKFVQRVEAGPAGPWTTDQRDTPSGG
jgi:pimeloyl-ACP methyl ester carboxylesterase